MTILHGPISGLGANPPELPFPDRRQQTSPVGAGERRQFGNSYFNLSPPARELAESIDRYKMEHRRRYITTDELLIVLRELGYSQTKNP